MTIQNKPIMSISKKHPKNQNSLFNKLSGLSIFILLIVFWFVLSELLPPQHQYLFPNPPTTAKAFWNHRYELLNGTKASFLILLPGYISATFLAIACGLIVGTSLKLRSIFIPFTRVAAPVPPTVYVPYAIALLPSFHLAAVSIVLVASFWPVFINSVAGAVAIPERHRDNARVLGFGRLEYLYRVALPASLPHIFNGANVGLGLAFIMLTVAELFGANAGLGRFVQYYSDFADYPTMLAGIIYTGLITFLSMSALGRLEKLIIFWPH